MAQAEGSANKAATASRDESANEREQRDLMNIPLLNIAGRTNSIGVQLVCVLTLILERR